jgi:hypothetical protein
VIVRSNADSGCLRIEVLVRVCQAASQQQPVLTTSHVGCSTGGSSSGITAQLAVAAGSSSGQLVLCTAGTLSTVQMWLLQQCRRSGHPGGQHTAGGGALHLLLRSVHLYCRIDIATSVLGVNSNTTAQEP